ncbi:Predicted DNA-binding protein with PD1-like DNA-binding motif [Chryseobacterium nakagawai]|uniref:DNA-binding protein n=1 Tax=Chryseobacterium nakagawai TaxID=1241982 RepID=A0AAD0YJ07_CHRNA|nr:PPC domain-containing DNA-binding protein [Chryseobacterium nakagawai]AZA89379.1 DNA-binding protein [Chryseobacterium nakagawai]VEH20728.1 Predicted DNA-binding protein with PD1-like DNA-binding motif [Chryseobacterium nakagawai]
MEIQNFKGNQWSARKVDQIYIVSIKNHSGIVEALMDFVQNQKIQSGEVTGIGAVSEATLRFFSFKTKKYVDKTFNEQMEVANISGNVSVIEEKPILHLHVTLGREDYTALAGHLLEAKVHGAGEFIFYPLNTRTVKTKDLETGINFYDFEK